MLDTTVPKTNIPTSPVAFLWFITKPFLLPAIFTLLFAVLFAVGNQSLTLFFKWIIEAIEAGDQAAALRYGLLYPCAVFAVQLCMRCSGFVAGKFWHPWSRKYANDILATYTLAHSHTYFSNRFAGALLTKINNVVGASENLLHEFVWSYLSVAVSLLVAFYFISTVDSRTALVFLVLIISLITVNRLLMPGKRRRSLQAAAAASRLRGTMVDVFSNITAARHNTSFEYEENYIKQQSMTWTKLSQANWMYTDRTQLLNSSIMFVCALLMFYWLTVRWSGGEITSGQFIFVVAIFTQLSGNLIHLGRMMVNAAREMGEMEEGLKEIVVPHDIVDISAAPKLQLVDGRIVWQDVTFTYNDAPVFDRFHLEIQPGQRLGLVGPSGAGKTTFVSLLLREHDVTAGTISIDGQDIAKVTQKSLRSAISIVPQEPALFHRTIRENIAYGKQDATEDEIVAVAKKAYAHDFIMSLRDGYETLVGERGVKLSGGQKQRIAIARAMLKNAPILILDEATSALDSESEVEIQRALHVLMTGKTVIAIAHRLSTLREMDRIIVLENGSVTEDGTHESLLHFGGTYARLWQHQAGGFVG
jgi:ATP-binding cassette, subfamily B, bacterial